MVQELYSVPESVDLESAKKNKQDFHLLNIAQSVSIAFHFQQGKCQVWHWADKRMEMLSGMEANRWEKKDSEWIIRPSVLTFITIFQFSIL